MPKVVVKHLSPSTHYHKGPPKFDLYQFQKRGDFAVRDDAGNSAPDQLAVSDFARCHVMRRKRQHARRLPTPSWATNDAELRELLVRFIERRLYSKPQAGTLKERLARAEEKIKSQVPRLQELLRQKIRNYKKEQSPNRQREIKVEIQNLDTRLRIIRKGTAAVLAAIVYMYYRQGFNSVTVAEQLGVTSLMVRQTLFRMARLANGKPMSYHTAARRSERHLSKQEEIFANLKRSFLVQR